MTTTTPAMHFIWTRYREDSWQKSFLTLTLVAKIASYQAGWFQGIVTCGGSITHFQNRQPKEGFYQSPGFHPQPTN